MEHNTPEMHALILNVTNAQRADDIELEQWKLKMGDKARLASLPLRKNTRIARKQIRYRLFRIRENKPEYDLGLKKWIELQFTQGMTWENFTFMWDVSATDPLKVVEQMEWDGQIVFDKAAGKKFCDPPAFTHQGI